MATQKGGRLLGKSILITGAAQGIGRSSAIACLNEGAHVVATDLNMEKLKELQTEYPTIEISHLDVTNEEEVQSVIKKYTTLSDSSKNINTVFNCAGIVFQGSIINTTSLDWDNTFEVNVKGIFCICKYIIQQWLASNVKGNIINMASVTSSIKGVHNRCVYGASKAAVIGLTKSIAVDYVENGIRTNAICPGTIKTFDRNSECVREMGGGDVDKGIELFTKRQKMGRLGKPEEIAAMVVYLASDETAFITGTEFIIDGGWTL